MSAKANGRQTNRHTTNGVVDLHPNAESVHRATETQHTTEEACVREVRIMELIDDDDDYDDDDDDDDGDDDCLQAHAGSFAQ